MSSGIILVVEDDPTLRMVMAKALKHLGYDCEVVGSGEEAVEKFSGNFSMIFMDIGLPGIQGEQATRLIRDKQVAEKLKHVPIVALTGHAARDMCLNAGMDDFLQKPAFLADLKKMIEKWMSDHQPSMQSPA
jgi:CheY-like chemotaxis protein